MVFIGDIYKDHTYVKYGCMVVGYILHWRHKSYTISESSRETSVLRETLEGEGAPGQLGRLPLPPPLYPIVANVKYMQVGVAIMTCPCLHG